MPCSIHRVHDTIYIIHILYSIYTTYAIHPIYIIYIIYTIYTLYTYLPMEMPTQGICVFEAENMPTRLSYRPPAAMEPTYMCIHMCMLNVTRLAYK